MTMDLVTGCQKYVQSSIHEEREICHVSHVMHFLHRIEPSRIRIYFRHGLHGLEA